MRCGILLLAVFLSFFFPASGLAQFSGPISIAVDPITNKIYVANSTSNSVTVIDGATNATTAVPVGSAPQAIAVDAVTNKIYVANYGGNSVTVIDGKTDATTTVPVGTHPNSIAVNQATGKIYVADRGTIRVDVNPQTKKFYTTSAGSGVTVIDGRTNATTTVAMSSGPVSLAVNEATDRIYAASGSRSVVVIDGKTNAVATVPLNGQPQSVAVNPVTNKIYVPTFIHGSKTASVTEIDGSTNATATVASGLGPWPGSVAVNSKTDRIYVVNPGSGAVTVIDRATNATATIAVGSGPDLLAVNPVRNKIYVTNASSNNVTVIDGATNATTTVAAGSGPESIAVNPVTDKIYVANYSSNNVTVIDGATNSARETQGKLPFSPKSATVLHLSPGPNWVDLHGDGVKKDLIFMAFRNNFNAHGFWVVTIYMHGRGKYSAEWNVVPLFDSREAPKDEEHDDIVTHYGGADCVLDDMRLVQVGQGKSVEFFLLRGKRVFGKSFADTQPVSFDVYRLKSNSEGLPGWPPYYFDYETTVQGKAKYCDIDDAFKAELGLSD